MVCSLIYSLDQLKCVCIFHLQRLQEILYFFACNILIEINKKKSIFHAFNTATDLASILDIQYSYIDI